MNIDILETLDKFKTNYDVLSHVFQYFSLKEQIKLVGVCTLFGDIIINYIWKYKYKELKVVMTSTSHYMITNILSDFPNELELVQECRTLLSETEFNDFFYTNAANIQKLFITKLSDGNENEAAIQITDKFINLRDLKYDNVPLDLGELAGNCTKLECLCICYNGDGTRLKCIDVAILEKIKTLKCLEIYSYEDLNLNIKDIFEKLKLQTLKIFNDRYHYKFFNEFPNMVIECAADGKSTESYPCKELCIRFNKDTTLEDGIKSLLRYLNNLKMWHLEGYENVITDKLLQTFDNCTKLQFLHLRYCRIFLFTPMHTLTDLILECCTDLTWKDLEIILSVMKLTSFTSLDTEYSGAYTYFEVSETLKYLYYDDGDSDYENPKMVHLFQTDKHNFKNLTTLKWKGVSTNSFFENIPTFCPNLQTLDVHPFNNEIIKQIFRLKSLHKFNYECENLMDGSDLLTLLKHSSLNHLKIRFYEDCYDSDDYDSSGLLLNDKCYTNLLFLDIDVEFFIHCEDFLLGLVSRNSRLNIQVHCEITSTWKYFLKELKNNSKFPKRLKSIKINGFNIDINDLRDNFDETYQWIKSVLTSLNSSEVVILL